MSHVQYYIIYKPFGVLSQFTKELPTHQTLGDYFQLPKDVYPVGRLDKDSEGLLILTNDGSLNNALLHPNFKHQRTYWVQVEGIPTEEALRQLQEGVTIRINKKEHKTLPAKATLLEQSPPLAERNPPIRERKNIPTSWLAISLVEGKNRQVRRMCAKVGFPVLRLVRASIEDLTIDTMQSGTIKEMQIGELKKLLKLR